MKNIKIIKTIEEIPLKKGVNLCFQVLNKPKNITRKAWVGQIRKDLISGRKFFRIRELILRERLDKTSPFVKIRVD